MAAQRRYLPDGEEHWFLDETWTNRMVLALRSGLSEEVSWSLFRLLTLSSQHGARFYLKPLPGLTDALFEWPLWWVRENGGLINDEVHPDLQDLWGIPPDVKQNRKHALESLLILRNASFNETNAAHLVGSSRTVQLLIAIDTLPKTDPNCEFITYCIEILQAIASYITPKSSSILQKSLPIPALVKIASSSNDRTLILASMNALTLLLNNSVNIAHVTPDSPVLSVAIKFLPLVVDRPLLTACLDFLFTHLSHPPAAKAFMHHPEMTNTVKLLVGILIMEQRQAPKNIAIGPPVLMAPEESKKAYYELTPEELQILVQTPEPARALNWMSRMFVFAPGEDETQVTFWNLYRDTFTPFQETCVGGISNAQEVIKNILMQFPKASAIVVPGPPQRFVIKHVKRREREGAYQCKWNRSNCPAESFHTADELYQHTQDHLQDPEPLECQWATCSYPPTTVARLRAHLATHVPTPPKEKHPDQPPGVTLPYEPFPYPSATPTLRPPPPPPAPILQYEIPIPDPPSTSLTALLILRLLFRVAFSDPGPAPPGADENRFGFPMPPALAEGLAAVGDERNRAKKDAMELDDKLKELEAEGERKGQRAFRLVSTALSEVHMGDELPASWIAEMLDAVDGQGIGEWGM